jgi:hypothetical protein
MKNIHLIPTDKPSRLIKQKYDSIDRLCLADTATKKYDDDSTETTRTYWTSFLGKYKDKEFSSKELFQEFLKTKQDS